MVYTLPQRGQPNASLGNQLGQSVSQGFLSAAQPAIQQQYQRGQLQEALGKLRQQSQNPNATPQDLLYNLIEASSYSPEIGRNLPALYDSLLKNINSRRTPEALNQGVQSLQPGGVSSQGSFQPGLSTPPQLGMTSGGISSEGRAPQIHKGKTGNEIQEFSDQYLKQLRPDLIEEGSGFGRVPTFDFNSRSSLTPEEETQIRNQLNEKKVSPELQDQVLNRINQSIGDRYKEALQNYNIDQNQQQVIDSKWKVVKEDAPRQLAPFISSFGPKTKDFLTNRYFQYAGRQPTNLTPEAVEGRAMASLQNDIDRLNALAEQPSLPPIRQFSDVRESMDNIKSTYKPLKEAGMTEALKEDATINKDMGLEEMHEAIWGDQTNKKLLNEIASVKLGKDKTQYISQVASKLKNLSPDDDLVLARAMVLDGGGTITDFRQALNEAIQNGLELSPFQESQLQEVQLPRQRPLWEIFSDTTAAPFGVVGMTFKHFLNYIRGKK